MSNETESLQNKVELKKPQNMTVRDAIMALAKVSDPDTEIAMSFYNSDPIPVHTIEETVDNLVVISGS